MYANGPSTLVYLREVVIFSNTCFYLMYREPLLVGTSIMLLGRGDGGTVVYW